MTNEDIILAKIKHIQKKWKEGTYKDALAMELIDSVLNGVTCEYATKQFADMETKIPDPEKLHKYYARFKIDARYEVGVDSEDIEAAKEDATYEFEGANFGEAIDIDGELISIEDVHGNFLWEKE